MFLFVFHEWKFYQFHPSSFHFPFFSWLFSKGMSIHWSNSFASLCYLHISVIYLVASFQKRTPIFVGGEFGQGRAVRFLEGDRVLCRVEAPGGLTTWEEGVVIGLWYREPCFNFKKARGLVGCFFCFFLKNLGETTSLFSLVGCSWSLRNMLLRYYLDNCSQFL